MCGINGIFAYHYAANPIDRSELLKTRDHMAKRGPDGFGEWVSDDGLVGFGHRRLSIIDLSDAASQPMRNDDGSLVITYNGEIYNYRELRRDLEAKGYRFKSQSDTEVILHLYAEKGGDLVHDLRGMFAFAIRDNNENELFLARDPYGIKPLYYADDGWTFRFASQVKALVAGGKVSKDPEPAGLVGFYLWGSVPEPFTTYQEIRCLPAGSTMRVDRIGAHAPQNYFSIASVYCDAEKRAEALPTRSVSEIQSDIRSALLDSIQSHLVADVPVGAFLSAGVDSGALVGLMRDAGAKDIKTITIGFEEFAASSNDETVLASDVARLYGTEHTTRIVKREEFEADLPLIFDAMDQPSIDGINTWFVSKAARELGLKVAISGLGGDEIFGGYPSFKDVPRWVSMMAIPSRVPKLGRLARVVLSNIVAYLGLNPKAAGLLEYGGKYEGAYFLKRGLYMPWELNSFLKHDVLWAGLRRLQSDLGLGSMLKPTPRGRFARVASLESSLYMRNQLLRDTDWASMAHGLEVRVPLVDPILLDRVARHQGQLRLSGKEILSSSPSLQLPETITKRSKTGFTTPVSDWITKSKSEPIASKRILHQPWARGWSQIVTQHLSAAA